MNPTDTPVKNPHPASVPAAPAAVATPIPPTAPAAATTAVTAPAPPTPSVRVILPGGVDDPAAPSGGNVYDRRICRDLPAAGWRVAEHAVPGTWPRPGTAAREELARVLRETPDGAPVLLDGLVACGVPDIVVPEAARLRLAVLLHLPLGDETGLAPETAAELDAAERDTLRSVDVTVATSHWAAQRLVRHHGLAPWRVHVAAPGADLAPLAPGSERDGGPPHLLCVASVTPRKAQHRLVEALAAVADLPWTCTCVGGLDQDPGYVTRLRELIAEHGLTDRVRLTGPRRGEELEASYAAADLTVLTSQAETYGMAVTEALAHGVPVLATAVGGVREAVGLAPDGSVPGALVPAGDTPVLAAALRRWLSGPDVRERWRAAALQRRTALAGWDTTSRSLADALAQLRPGPRGTA
ncbi:glycosyltransferase family 4 protein [Streptomyces zingiberis]|uniref:D-inositol 3-phosphate glycosyltransferase n=1 Tax=Streptomyces zingiberis TaxID=2053010 RepID=A0ABX1BRB7_9ACTN|nr:glycosyltransferase family 4 protein [Streptomyces zingiberis]NJP99587.1 glycosyltransferase family 4 protein [Streptomyces zingiberis]